MNARAWFNDAMVEIEVEDEEAIVSNMIDDLATEILYFGVREGHLTEADDVDEWRREISGFLLERRQRHKDTTPYTEITAMQEVVDSFTDDECSDELAAALNLGLTDQLSLEWIEMLKYRVRYEATQVRESRD